MKQFRYPQALFVFIGILFIFLVSEAILASSQLRHLLYVNFQQRITSNIDLMADSAYEAALKADYVTISTFIKRWGATHPEYFQIKAVAPNGFVIAEHTRPTPRDDRATISRSKTLSLDGTELLRLELGVDPSPQVEAIAKSLRNRLFAYALLFISILGVVLWWALQTLAIQPLEKEILRRTLAEDELKRAHEHLESIVEQRTASLSKELAERRRVEAELVGKEEHIRLLLESTAEGIFGVDTSGTCTFCNPSALHLLGYGPDTELLGTTVLQQILQPPASPFAAGQESLLVAACRIGQSCHSEMQTFRRQDGSSFPAECWSHPVYDNSGMLIGAVVTFIDISGRKQLEQQLVQSRKMEAIGTLASGIAHDFNNILTPILGYTEIALRKSESDSTLQANLQSIHAAACRARDLVKQILTFSRRDSGEVSSVEVSQVVHEALELLKASLPATIEIREHVTENCGTVSANATNIHQIVMNLGTNAYHAMREAGGILTVSLVPQTINSQDRLASEGILFPGKYLLLEMADTGHGMAPSTVDRIFEPYFTTKPAGQGTGMGLAVVHGLIESYGGHITVESTIGKGTTFRIYLPVAPPPVSPARTAMSFSLPPGGTERILLIDDETYILQVQSEVLESLGYSVRAIDSPLSALEEFRRNPDNYDVVITDMTMPKMTGDKLARQILALRPGIPIVMCSGVSDLENGKIAEDSGIAAYVNKPVSIDDLAMKLRKVLGAGEKVIGTT